MPALHIQGADVERHAGLQLLLISNLHMQSQVCTEQECNQSTQEDAVICRQTLTHDCGLHAGQ